MFDIVEAKTGRRFKNWLRKSDGCSSQSKCRYSTAQLMMINNLLERDLGKVEFQYFETDEGKSESDMARVLVKACYEKGVMRPVSDEHEAPRTVSEVVNVINANISENLPKIEFFHVEAFPEIDRSETPPAAALPGIRQLHSLTRRTDGSRLGLKLSCSTCTVATICESCSDLSATAVKLVDGSVALDDDDQTTVEVIPPTLPDLHVEDSSDAEEEEEDPDEADDGFTIGSVVWIMIGRLWFPPSSLSF